MLVLFDQGTPRGIARWLLNHTVKEAKSQGWDRLTNGELLNAAEQAGFDVLLTTDKNLRYQQNLEARRIAIVVLGKGRWRLIRPMISAVVEAVNVAQPGTYTEVDIRGKKPNLKETILLQSAFFLPDFPAADANPALPQMPLTGASRVSL